MPRSKKIPTLAAEQTTTNDNGNNLQAAPANVAPQASTQPTPPTDGAATPAEVKVAAQVVVDPPKPSPELSNAINDLYKKVWAVVEKETEETPINAMIITAALGQVMHRLGYELGQDVALENLTCIIGGR